MGLYDWITGKSKPKPKPRPRRGAGIGVGAKGKPSANASALRGIMSGRVRQGYESDYQAGMKQKAARRRISRRSGVDRGNQASRKK